LGGPDALEHAEERLSQHRRASPKPNKKATEGALVAGKRINQVLDRIRDLEFGELGRWMRRDA